MSFIRKMLLPVAAAAMLGAGVAGGYAEDAAKPDPNKVLVTVNGSAITEGEVALAETDLDPQFANLPPEQRRVAALSALIDIRTLAVKAEADKLDQTPDFKQRMDFLRERALHNAYFKAKVADTITDPDVKARYDKEVAAAPKVDEVHAYHILVKTEDEAKAIIKQLDGGASFEDIAKKESTDGSAADGGDLGYFAPGQMVPEFDKAAFALKVGTYTEEPVHTQFGWHVIKVVDKRPKQPPAFDQVKDQVRSVLMRERYVELVQGAQKEEKIEYTDPALEKAVKDATGGQ
jgi:peptidyl-prolyl cis-trans isomerase C